MKNVALVGILAVASLFTGCRSDINKVRNGYLEYNRTTTVGQALEHTFSNGTWKSFTTEKGVTIVEFDASEPFSENFAFAPVVKMIDDYCNSDAGKALYSKDQSLYDAQKAQIAQLQQQKQDIHNQIDDIRKIQPTTDRSSPIPYAEQLDQAMKESGRRVQQIDELYKKANDLDTQETELSNKVYISPDGHATCLATTTKQHANDLTPVVVQFSINHDGTFQYEATDMPLSAEGLFEKIYK